MTEVVNIRNLDVDSPSKLDPEYEYVGRWWNGKRHIATTEVGEIGWLGNPFSVEDTEAENPREMAVELAGVPTGRTGFRCHKHA